MAFEKVLIIEDNKSFASILRQMISVTEGYSVDIIDNHKAANELLDSKSTDYFAAVVDLNLPDAAEGEAVKSVLDAGIPVIVFTGSTNQELEDSLWRQGVADYAHKTGLHSVEYVAWMLKRLYNNRTIDVLVVDDSKSARQNLNYLLSIQNFNVYAVGSGSEALTILESNENVNLVIIDVYMEEMDGFQLCETIRNKYPQRTIEIIGVSGIKDANNSAKFLKSGARDFLFKPFSPEEFYCRVNLCADRLEAMRELYRLSEIKNDILGMAAHDIRGPVSGILSASKYLLSGKGSTEKQQTYLKLISSTSQEVLDLVSEILDVSSIENDRINLNCKSCNISDLVNERVDLYRMSAELKGVGIKTELTTNLIANIDLVRIKQAFDNLLTNAIKFSPPGGIVSIRTFSDGTCIFFDISDQGAGIPSKEIDRLFQKYSTTSSVSTSGEAQTGLGLSIVKRIAEAHYGTVSYTENEGGGARFIFGFKSQ